MPSTESNDKRKLKTKMPKRLKNRARDLPTNDVQSQPNPIREDRSLLRKERIDPETTPFFVHPLRSSIDVTKDPTSIFFWRYSTQKALELLQKQAIHRRNWLIARCHERFETMRRFIAQREQIERLTEQNHSMSELVESLRSDFHSKEQCIDILQMKLHDFDEFVRENEFLRLQLKSSEQKLERFTIEYAKKIDEHRRFNEEAHEQIQSLFDEIERIKRDLILEEYRKQEAERKARSYEDKFKVEQNLNKKIQQENNQMKNDLKSIQNKYDALQIEMLAMHKANQSEISFLPSKDTIDESDCSHQQTIEQSDISQIQRTKRKTRDRTESSASTASSSSNPPVKIPRKSLKVAKTDISDSKSKMKRKTAKSKNIDNKHLPTLTVTEASPSVDPMELVEKDSCQYLLPSSASVTSDGSAATTDTMETSTAESRPVSPRRKKASRYPCRRAQRPAKVIETNVNKAKDNDENSS